MLVSRETKQQVLYQNPPTFFFSNPRFVLVIHDWCLVLLSLPHFCIRRFSPELTLRMRPIRHPLERHSLVNERMIDSGS